MRVLISMFCVLSVSAQTYETQFWGVNGSISGVTAGFYDRFTVANNQPAGTFKPEGTCWENGFTDPLGTRSMILRNDAHHHAYSSLSIFSAKSTYTLIFSGSSILVYNTKTCALVRTVPTGPGSAANTIHWSAIHDTRLYALHGKLIQMYDVVAGGAAWTTLVNLDGTGGRPNLTSISSSQGTVDGSSDDHFAFYSHTETTVCVVDLETAGYPLSCYNYAGLSLPSAPDNPHISKGASSLTGRRYVVLQGSFPNVQLQYTTVAGGLTFSHQWECFKPAGQICEGGISTGNRDGMWVSGETWTRTAHSDTGFTPDGRQFYIRGYDQGNSQYILLIWLDLETAALVPTNTSTIRRNSVTTISRFIKSMHAGCSKHAPVCVQTSYAEWMLSGGGQTDYRPLATASEPYQTSTPGGWLVEWIRIGGTNIADLTFKMVAHTRGQIWEGYGFNDWYYNIPRTCISPDGQYIAYDSQFGNSNTTTRRVAIGNIGQYDPKALRVTGVGSTTATLRYMAPNSTACTVTVSANSDYTSPVVNAVSDGGNTNERAYSITGLTTGTRYFTRATCNGVTENGPSFHTR